MKHSLSLVVVHISERSVKIAANVVNRSQNFLRVLNTGIAFIFLGTLTWHNSLAQGKAREQPMPDLHLPGSVEAKEPVKHKDLETELEIYPFNIIVPNDPVIKNEAMFDYHLDSDNDRWLVGARFFADANTHYESGRDMKDLLMYTELYYGLKYFQLGGEVGSITGEEYLTLGPQFTAYDNLIFKRVSVISRVLPDYVIGYEFTTQEVNVTKHIKLSATGMGRLVFPSDQMVIQASAWVSVERMKGLFLGVEYEYNNAKFFNTYHYEKNNEFFFGLKFELH